MLMALNEKKQQVQLLMNMHREGLREMRKEHIFYCPACKERVILKVGEIMIPHFAHMKNDYCDSFSEGESQIHIKGKLLLYEWFKAQGIPTLLEPYLGAIKQRPDLLIKINNHYTAIEFQCSMISNDMVNQRTAGYGKLSIETVWIPIGQKVIITGMQKTKLNNFYQSFIKNNQVVMLDVASSSFYKVTKLIHISGQQFFTSNTKYMLKDSIYPFNHLIEEKINEKLLLRKWFEERQRFLKNRLRFNKRGLKDAFLFNCYKHKIALLNLPNWIGVPSRDEGRIHSVEWQLIIVILLRKYEVDGVYVELVKQFPQYRVTEQVVDSYLRFLKAVNPKLVWRDLDFSQNTFASFFLYD